ncbi:hypothetical protein F5050DRAFT_1572918 [Lentinula boryana]|uniref:Uncharacterized protein n=1 Tax=Lentinula boryana TaxID=40481 RepID=A0ABQ8QB68_9AGAR|nr:hypothetical protein F5050DRAFT_1572918 [Lentinula boryana]
MWISVQQKKGPLVSRTIKHKQFPLTLAYVFTDYRAQGQTIALVIIDIASPPTGSLNLFNIYVALSHRHSAELLAEDDKLEKIENETRKWWEEMRKGHGRIDAV